MEEQNNNSAKNNAVKKSKIRFAIVTIVCIILMVAGVAFESYNENFVYLAILGVIILFFAVILHIQERNRIRRTYCVKCGAKYDYEEDVAWQVDEVINEKDKQVAVVNFACCCAECGHTFNYKKKYTTASLDPKTHSVKRHNIDSLIKKEFNIKD